MEESGKFPFKLVAICAGLLLIAFVDFSCSTNGQADDHETYSEMYQRHEREERGRYDTAGSRRYETHDEMRARHVRERDAKAVEMACDFDAACIVQQQEAEAFLDRVMSHARRERDERVEDFLRTLIIDATTKNDQNDLSLFFEYTRTMNWLQTKQDVIQSAAVRGIIIFDECTAYGDCYTGELR